MSKEKGKKDGYSKVNTLGTITALIPYVLIGLGVFILYKEINEILAYVCFGVAVVSFIIAMICSNYLNKRCKKCHELLFGSAYEWSVVKQKVRGGSSSNNEPQYELTYYIVHTCPNCGAVDKEKRTFFSKNGFGDCEVKMRNYCCKKFGH